MYSRTRRKKRTESMEATAGEREDDEEDDDNDSQLLKGRDTYQRRDFSTTTDPTVPPSLSSLAVPITDDRRHHSSRSSAIHIAQLLEEADLGELIQHDWLTQIKFFVNERAHLLHQLDFIRTQFEKQYSSLKRRLDETESENERLTIQHRRESKELALYKHLVNASETSDSLAKTKDYQQLKLTIDAIVKENERLYGQINDFKTSDPVYEQVQLLERANQHLKQDLVQLTNQNNRLKKFINIDEIKHLKSHLAKTIDECEHLKGLNKKLLNEIEKRKYQQQQQQQYQLQPSSSPKQISIPPPPQYSPKSQHSSSSIVVSRNPDENLPALTVQNLRQFDIVSRYPLPPVQITSPTIDQLQENVHLLERKLQQRDHELQTLQIEIEKGTSSIMSSLDDLYMASSSVSPNPHSPKPHRPLLIQKSQPTIQELQNEIDQLHDKLDELTRENQQLKNRTQEFDTIYEENEYLYAEKSHWNEEIERSRIRELVLEQEIQTLKEREKELLSANDSTDNNNNNNNNNNNTNIQQLKLKIDWFNRTNNQLELEIVRLNEQMDLLTHKCQETKKELIQKDEHYKQLLVAAQDKQQLPHEITRLEKLKTDLENQVEKQREEYEQTIAHLEEQGDKREQKYSSLYETIVKLQNDHRQKELDYVQQMDEILKQRDQFHHQIISLQNDLEQIQQENKALKEEIKSKDAINRDLKLALTSSNNDAQQIYNQLRQLNTNLAELQQKYDRDLAERDQQIEIFYKEQKQLIANHDNDSFKSNQTLNQLQNENNQYLNQIETYKSTIEKLHIELEDKQNFIEHVQTDLTERSTLHANHLAHENKTRLTKITELEQALAQEQQRKAELQRTIQDLQSELLKSRAVTKESLEKSQELERRFHESDKHFEETIRTHLTETTEPTRRELSSLRAELVTKSDQITLLQNALDEEKLKRQRLEMKLKRLKDEYINVRKELYSRIEENNNLQHELIECRFKNDYNLHITTQTFNSLKSSNEDEGSTAAQIYLKEKTEGQHWQLKCRAYQQKLEQLQKNYDLAKEKYKQRLHEEREIFERTKTKYLDHIKNVQNDLHETRRLLEKDAELKVNQESAYQQLIDERRQLLTSMVDKDAKVREMRRENLLLTSKIQLLEDQMENLNERVDKTLRERNQLRREINSVRLDSNVSIQTSARSSPVPSPTRTTTSHIETTSSTQPIHHSESFGFNNNNHHHHHHHTRETSPVS